MRPVPTCGECNYQAIPEGEPMPTTCPNCDGDTWTQKEEGSAGAVIPCCEIEACQYERETDSGLCPSCREHAGEIACKVCEETVFASSCCS